VKDDNDFKRECDRDDCSYIYPVAGEGEEVQWALMAKDGVVTKEEADRLVARDTEIAKARLARKRPSRMSDIGRLQFMRTLSLHGWTQADLAPASTRRTNRRLA
jgi:hypothetical protein